MNNIVIQVENLSKQYRLGVVGRKTLNQDINRWWHQLRGKEDPYLKIGQENDRAKKGTSEYVWALRDINFEVKRGEVFGIIGKNGAGKSTLLKILSKVTSPTTGIIKTKGRIASLLEVGTGFHPDLTGRQNVFLNGAILGMTKKEVKKKFDEIVDFSGVERYIDTPVKRYSSGMYVRLAFAVAAHLEPEILIVDEVLAVGDAEFQRKCLGRMRDASRKEGRTVFFVSHNMQAIDALCNNAIMLNNGTLIMKGDVREVIAAYINNSASSLLKVYHGNGIVKKICLLPKAAIITYNKPFELEVEFSSSHEIQNVVLGVVIKDFYGMALMGINNRHYYQKKLNASPVKKGRVIVQFQNPKLLPGNYVVDIFFGDSITDLEVIENAIHLSIEESIVTQTATPLDYRLNKIYSDSVYWKLIET